MPKRVEVRKPLKPLKTAAAAGAAGAGAKALKVASQTTRGKQSLRQLSDDRFLSRNARSLAGGDKDRYNAAVRRASEHRTQWVREPAKGGDDVIGMKSKHVTSDNRPEVRKGSKASGITVNNKLVRQGKVRASEKAFAKGAAKAVAKAGLRYAGLAGALATAADIARSEYGKPGPEFAKGTSAKSKGSNARSVKSAKKKSEGG